MLHCVALYCIALQCIVLYCIVNPGVNSNISSVAFFCIKWKLRFTLHGGELQRHDVNSNAVSASQPSDMHHAVQVICRVQPLLAGCLSPWCYIQLSRSNKRAHDVYTITHLYQLCKEWKYLPITPFSFGYVVRDPSGSGLAALRKLEDFFGWKGVTVYPLRGEQVRSQVELGRSGAIVLDMLCAACANPQSQSPHFVESELRELIFLIIHKTDPPISYTARDLRSSERMACMGHVGLLKLLRSKARDGWSRRWTSLCKSSRRKVSRVADGHLRVKSDPYQRTHIIFDSESEVTSDEP